MGCFRKNNFMKSFLLLPWPAIGFLVFLGCATAPPSESQRTIPLQEASLDVVIEENEGLEVVWEDAKDIREFYRGGVQQKAQAEKRYEAKAYPQAMKLYQSSNEFLTKLLQYIPEDYAQYPLYEDTHILFFPHLLMADNHLKMGKILHAMERERSAQRHWKQALSSVKESLKTERTEWALNLQQELISLLPPKK
jgi:hypothetical protein